MAAAGIFVAETQWDGYCGFACSMSSMRRVVRSTVICVAALDEIPP